MKITINQLHILVLLFFPFTLFSQSEAIFNGISLENSTKEVIAKLSPISATVNLISPKSVRFPLAKNKEDHLVCTNVKTNNGTIDKVIFTFADNQLTYIQAKGNVYKAFTEQRKDTARTYMDYEVFVKDKLFVKKEKDIAWIISEEAMHVNLFTWDNPYLIDGYKLSKNNSSRIPEFVKMGEELETLQPILETNSLFTNTETLDGTDPNAQLQINCFGVDYMGFPRKFEARFGDNKLNVVWILTAKGEEDRIRQSLIKQYGNPIFVNESWEIFNNWQVGLRKDKPEVLLMEQKIGLEYKTNYFKQ